MEKPKKRKSVGLAFALGVIFLGNFYIGQGSRGVLFIVLFLIGLVTTPLGLGVFIVLASWLGSIATSTFGAINRNS